MNKKSIFKLTSLIALASFSMAGTAASIGTDSGTQLLIPAGAKGIALNSSNCASVSGADALYYNPAGISASDGTAAQFSSYNYIADINVNYAAFVSSLGNGTVGLSFKSMDFGDIKRTSGDDTEGTSGQTYSPNFMVFSASYSKNFTDRVRFGSSFKLVNEQIDKTGGQAIGVDMGVQYQHESLPLNLGVVLRNLGTKMVYSGGNLESDNQTLLTQASNLPAQLNMAASYSLGPVDIHAGFTNNSYGFNEISMGGEFELSMGDINGWIGGGMNMFSLDEELDEEYSTNPFGISIGGGLSMSLSNFNVGIDYGMKTSDTFSNTGVIALNIGF